MTLVLNYVALFLSFVYIVTSDDCKYNINGYEYDLTPLSHSVVTHDNFYNYIDWSYSFSPCRNEISIRNFVGMASQINEHNGFTYHLATFDESVEMRPLLVDDKGDVYNFTSDDYVYNSNGLGFQLKWQNGDICGNSDNSRIFKVNFICDESSDGVKHLFNSESLTLVESPSCTYTFTVPTKYACTKNAKKVSTSSSSKSSNSHSSSSSNSKSSKNSGSSNSKSSSSKSSGSSRSSSGSSSSSSNTSTGNSSSNKHHGHWSTLTTLFFVALIGFALYMLIRFIINVKNDPMNDWTDINNIPHIETWIQIKDSILNCLNGCVGIINETNDYTPLLTSDGKPMNGNNNNNSNNTNDVCITTDENIETLGNHIGGGSNGTTKTKRQNKKDADDAMNDEIESMLENIDL